MDKIEYQILTINKMVVLYCKQKHGSYGLCDECDVLFQYAKLHLEKCPYNNQKPECRDCTIHCYNNEMRLRMKEVMRFSGPRMLIYYPGDFLKHLINKKRD